MGRIKIGNIKGPKGDTGPKGATGAIGPVGPQGPLPPLTNNALATVPGVSALDAVMGKTLQDQLDQQNSDLGKRGLSATGYVTETDLSTNQSTLYTYSSYTNDNDAFTNTQYRLNVKDTGVYAVEVSAQINNNNNTIRVNAGYRKYLADGSNQEISHGVMSPASPVNHFIRYVTIVDLLAGEGIRFSCYANAAVPGGIKASNVKITRLS